MDNNIYEFMKFKEVHKSRKSNEIHCCRKIVIIVIAIAQLGAMAGKATITQILVRGVQWDSNMSAMACGGATFLNIVTK